MLYAPAVSPADGRLVYSSSRGGGLHLWAAAPDGGEARRLTDGAGGNYANFSPDGRRVAYLARASWPWSLWRLPLDGGEPSKVSDNVVGRPVFSSDGERILAGYYDPDERVRSRRKQAILPAEGGPPLKLFEAPAYRILLDWAPDGRGFYYIQNSLTVSNLWRQPAGGGPPAQVTRFESGRLFNFAWRGDGRALAVARGEERSDALLISDFR